eukprot:scaffold365_cov361-Pavlova_lutheri.AAC.3
MISLYRSIHVPRDFANLLEIMPLVSLLLHVVKCHLCVIAIKTNGGIVEAAQALVPGRSNPLGTTTEFRSSTFEEYGAPVGPRRAMPIPAVFDTDEDRSRFTERSSAVDEAAIEWGYSPLILACNTQLRRWQPTNVSKVNTLLLTWYRSPFEAEENRKQQN